ncbi:MAG: VOC family protein [Burkholderiaceae bacterium]
MAAILNHTIVWCRDAGVSAGFLAEMLDLEPAERFFQFHVVTLGNGVSLDFMSKEGPVSIQHYAFLVDEPQFDKTLARIRAREIPHWADPARSRAGQINTHWGGRGVYFTDPDGHLLEIITRPYGDPQALDDAGG